MPRVRLSNELVAAGGLNSTQLCQCGRPSTYVHCPHCGSTNFYGLSEKSRAAKAFSRSGSELPVRVFACKACLSQFMENQCSVMCKAQPTAAQERENAVYTKVAKVPTEVRGEVADYVRELARRRGLAKPEPKTTLKDRVNENGLLEQADRERREESTLTPDKLFTPPNLDEGL